LKYPNNSEDEKAFLEAAAELEKIPGVQKFEMLRQISKKNKFDFGISMEFDDNIAYDSYSGHPDHESFLAKYWKTGVEDFLEIDYTLLSRTDRSR